MSNSKEVSKLYVDNQVVRIIAAQVLIIALLSLLFNSIFPAFLLVVDFALRAFTQQPSPLAAIAKITAHSLKIKSQPIFAAPKKFAAAVGFIFSIAIFVLIFLKYITFAYLIGGILIFFAFLESVFKICVGCYVYSWVVAPLLNRK